MKKPTLLMTACVLSLATSCGGNDTNDPMQDETTTSADDSSSETGTPIDIEELYECEDTLIEALPLSGPGYDPDQGLIEPQETYFASTTQILVKPEAMEEFLGHVAAIQTQLETTEGFVAMSVAIEPNCGFNRTLAVWRSEVDMYRFVGTGAHAEAMARTSALATTGKTTFWQINGDEMPVTWDAAKAVLDETDPLDLGGY